VVYSRQIKGKEYSFGVSGRLYRSNVLLYDHQTETLWSQLMEKAVAGPLAGTELTRLPSSRIRWHSWQARHPDTRVLSTDTGFSRNYRKDPYEGYARVGSLWFPVGNVRTDLSAKERILGVETDSASKAYPLEWLRIRPGVFEDTVGATTVSIEVNNEGEVVSVTGPLGNPLPHLFAYWFAWQAFHPETQVWRP
jgi:hypothetical protein